MLWSFSRMIIVIFDGNFFIGRFWAENSGECGLWYTCILPAVRESLDSRRLIFCKILIASILRGYPGLRHAIASVLRCTTSRQGGPWNDKTKHDGFCVLNLNGVFHNCCQILDLRMLSCIFLLPRRTWNSRRDYFSSLRSSFTDKFHGLSLAYWD